MASQLHKHRVLIASLFLPYTVDLDPSPAVEQRPPPLPPLAGGIAEQSTLSALKPAAATKLKSIVEDLSVKANLSQASPSATPAQEVANPLAAPFPGVPSLVSSLKTLARPALSRVSSGAGNAFFGDAPRPLFPSQPAAGTPKAQDDTDAPLEFRTKRPGAAPNTTSSPTSSQNAPTVQRRTSRRSPSNTRSVHRAKSNSLIGSPLPTDGSTVGPTWDIVNSFHGNVGLQKAVASIGEANLKKQWIGVLDAPTDGFSDDMRKEVQEKLTQSDNVPVWVKDDDFKGCYDEFCHQVLWPSLHYAVPDAPRTKVFYESSSFEQYKTVNQKFADTIVAQYQDGDIIFVNDYHLCLVPQMVREKLPHATIGFFLHVAWPTTEIFRCLAVRKQLLYGLLASDLIGFQTHNYARHFRQTCSRILGLEALPKGIQLADWFVDVAVFPIGIDVTDLTARRRSPEVSQWAHSLKQRYAGKRLIVGRDKLDVVQGVRHKILAFEEFLDRYPEFRDQVVLIQVALSTTEENEQQAGISDVVSRVNSRFGSLTHQPVVLLHTQDITFPMYLGLLTAADAFIATSLREGMALRTHEYVECQEERKRPLILSEFTGTYSYSGFRSCIAINPWDYRNTADAIHQSLTMSDEEATSRWQDLHNHVVTQTAQAFITSFLTRCIRVHLEHGQRDPASIPALDLQAVLPQYKAATRPHSRLLLVDLESTLWAEDPRLTKEHGFVPPKDALDVLQRLSDDPANQVWVLSGLPVKDGLEKIANVVPGVGLVAENGCFTKQPHASEWNSTVEKIDLAWKPLCVEILGYFTERTPGSFVEERGASVVWRYINGNPDEGAKQWALRQAAEAQNHIWDSLGERFGLRIIPGSRSFLVLPKTVNRSTAVASIFANSDIGFASPVTSPNGLASWTTDSPEQVKSEFDLVLALTGDEYLIRRVNQLKGAESVTTSGKGSDAMWRLDQEDVVKTLKEFTV